MKTEKGITLITLIIYVFLTSIIIAAISNITSSFYTTADEFDSESESAVAYSKFNMYFINDIKRKGIQINEVGDNYIILDYLKDVQTEEDGVIVIQEKLVSVQYLVQDGILYRDKVKICENVQDVLMVANEEESTVNIKMIIGDYEKETLYKLESL